jgi:PAS domain S-box-containing protein
MIEADEGALQQSLELGRLVVENLPDFVVLVDRERRFLWVNRVAPGLTLEQVLGRPLDTFTSGEGLATMRASVEAAFASGKVGQYEVQGYRDGKTTAWYLTRVVPIVGADGRVDRAMLMTSDISELKQAEQALRATEEQLHRAQRLESIGQLAGGIAHDFNNLLQVIQGSLHFVKRAQAEGKSIDDELLQIERAADRATELTSHLLAIGRRKRIEPKRMSLDALVSECVRMLRRTIPEHIQFDYRGPAEPCFADVDAPHLEQVLINLCVNARDAMPDGGKLSVRVQPAGETMMEIVVEDTGFGIASENLGRVFEPFFTTKGAGSGLGLAVATGIVAAHHGTIQVESEVGKGTTMRVRLPRAPAAETEPRRTSHETISGSGLILIAEDEDLVRAQLRRILTSSGYRVLEAEHGARAVELFKEHRGEIAMVVLDVIMPELDGWQAYLQMKALEPRVKVLFTTGYAASALPEDFAADGARLVSKPYSPSVLLADVRALLERGDR